MRRSSSGSAFTWAPSGVAPSGRAGASASGPSGSQWVGAPRSDEASRSSPNAAPSAFSKPGCDGHRVEQRRPQRAGGRLQRRGDARLLGAQLGQPRIGLLQQLVGGGDSSPRRRRARPRAPAPSRCDRPRRGRPPGARPPIRSARPRAPARSPRRPDARPLPRRDARLRAPPSTSASAGRFDSSASIWRCWPATSSRRISSRRRRSCSSAISRLTLSRSASSSAIWRVRRSCSASAATVAACASSRASRGRVGALVLADPLLFEPGALGIEIGDRGLGIALAAALAAEVAFGLVQPGLGLLLRRGDALGFGRQRIVRDAQALQGGGSRRLFIAQRRQRRRGVGLRRRGEADQPREVGDLRLGFLQAARRLRPARSRSWPSAAPARRLRRGGYGPTGCGSGWPGAPGASGPCAAPRARRARPARARGSARRRAGAARPRGGGHRGR